MKAMSVLTIRLPDDLAAQVRERAKKERVSVNAVTHALFERWLRSEEDVLADADAAKPPAVVLSALPPVAPAHSKLDLGKAGTRGLSLGEAGTGSVPGIEKWKGGKCERCQKTWPADALQEAQKIGSDGNVMTFVGCPKCRERVAVVF